MANANRAKEIIVVDRESFKGWKIQSDQSGLVDVVNSSDDPLYIHSSGEISTDNSTSTPLGADAVFTGEAEDITHESVIIITVYSDKASATDGLSIQWSTDGTNWDGSDDFTIPAATQKTFSFQPVAKYMRIKYTNGSVEQTEFRLQTIFKATYVKPSSHRIADSLSNQDDAELVKAVLSGEKPNGDFVNYGATRLGNFPVAVQEYGDTSTIDAFDRLRVSNPYTIFDSKQLHDKQPLFWDESIGGAATSTHSGTDARVRMTVTASASDFVIRQTRQRFNYQPGKSQLIFFTFYGAQEEGLIKRAGLFSGTGVNNLTPNNGVFFETDSDISWNIAKGGTITETVTQANWNFDKLDGTGPSGVTLDMDATQIGIIDYEWLGVGRVRVGFVINGLIRYCHYFNHSNDSTYTSVYMSTPNLPLRYSIQTDGTAGGSFDHICSTVISEGGIEETGILRAVSTGTAHIDCNSADTTYPILGIKLQSSYYDVTVKPEFFSLMAETDNDFRWSLMLNPTIVGVFSYSNVANSAIQFAQGTTSNYVTSYEVLMDAGFVSSARKAGGGDGRKFVTALRMGSKIDGTLDSIVLCATPLTAGAYIHGALTIRELL